MENFRGCVENFSKISKLSAAFRFCMLLGKICKISLQHSIFRAYKILRASSKNFHENIKQLTKNMKNFRASMHAYRRISYYNVMG